jgi:hypothetical protein
VKRLLLALLLAVLLVARAEAQEVQPDLSFRFGIGLLLIPEIQLSFEARELRGGLGVRVHIPVLFFAFGYGIDAYIFVPLSPEWDIYAGGGWSSLTVLFASPSSFAYGLLGVRLRNGFFLEVTPGVRTGVACEPPPANAGLARTPPCFALTPYSNFSVIGTVGFSWRI